jgi:hypothetical protein
MKRLLLVAATWAPVIFAGSNPVDVQALLRKSVANTERNWSEAPNFVFTEHDIQEKLDSRGRVKSKVDKFYEVSMLDGSPYERVIALNGKPLSAQQKTAEDTKMDRERRRRLNESRADRARRAAKYEKERKQNQAMLREMAEAFDYKLIGETTLNGRQAYVLSANPKPGYLPKTRDTKVLPAMKGKLFIDKADTQWLKVEAEVMHPVSFYAVATVAPGTKFVLEQEPTGNKIWMAKHFSVRVNSNVLWIAHNSNTDETYSNYRRVDGEAARAR